MTRPEALALLALTATLAGCGGPVASCGLWRSEAGETVEILAGRDRAEALGGVRRTFLREVPLPEDGAPVPFPGGDLACDAFAVDLSFDGTRARIRTAPGVALAYVDLARGEVVTAGSVDGEADLFPADGDLPPRQTVAGRAVRWFPTVRIPQP